LVGGHKGMAVVAGVRPIADAGALGAVSVLIVGAVVGASHEGAVGAIIVAGAVAHASIARAMPVAVPQSLGASIVVAIVA